MSKKGDCQTENKVDLDDKDKDKIQVLDEGDIHLLKTYVSAARFLCERTFSCRFVVP